MVYHLLNNLIELVTAVYLLPDSIISYLPAKLFLTETMIQISNAVVKEDDTVVVIEKEEVIDMTIVSHPIIGEARTILTLLGLEDLEEVVLEPI